MQRWEVTKYQKKTILNPFSYFPDLDWYNTKSKKTKVNDIIISQTNMYKVKYIQNLYKLILAFTYLHIKWCTHGYTNIYYLKWPILQNEYFYFWYFKYILHFYLSEIGISLAAEYFYTIVVLLLLKVEVKWKKISF